MNSEHDKIAVRLASILSKFNDGKVLSVQSLAEEFNVSLRTIQRDLNVRLAFLPLEIENNRYRLQDVYLNKLSSKDIVNFATIAGIDRLFPNLGQRFIADLLGTAYSGVYAVQGHNYENIEPTDPTFTSLSAAIKGNQLIDFQYKGKYRANLQPYQLINSKGIWYLAAVDNDTLKSYALSKIVTLRVLTETFTPDAQVSSQIAREDSIWFGEEKTEVVMKVSSDIAGFFKRRKLVPHQEIVREVDDGHLLVSSKISSPLQIVPIIKYWIPHIRVISPEYIADMVFGDIERYKR